MQAIFLGSASACQKVAGLLVIMHLTQTKEFVSSSIVLKDDLILVAKVVAGLIGMFLFISPHPVRTLGKLYRRCRGRS